MGSDYFLFYAEASIVCIIIQLMILVNDKYYRTQQEKQIWFGRTIIAFILYFLSDIGWAAVLSGYLPRNRFLIVFFNLTNYVILSLSAYEWFIYMSVSEKVAFRDFRRAKILLMLPMAVSTLIMVCAYFASPFFWISESGELNPLYSAMQIAAPVLYLLTAFVISLVNAGKAKSRQDRNLFLLIGIFPLVIILSGLVQVLFLEAPVFCFGCTIMILFFYIQNTQTLISVDDLTRLNNRGQINRFMDLFQYRDNAGLFVMMIDVDRFKQINDTYGHAEGDRALVFVADALKRICERYHAPVFLGRYGGDEFIMIIQNPEEDEYPEQAAVLIRDALSEIKRQHALPYELEISVGYEALGDRDDTLKACTIRADEKLYREKRIKG